MLSINMLIERYKNELYNYCFRLTFNKHDADDLFQETWLKAVKNRKEEHDDYFKSWLFSICSNQYKDNYRRRNIKKKYLKEDFESTYIKDYILTNSDVTDSPEKEVENQLINSILVSKIDKLPTKQKIPIVLFYYQDMKYDEIATILKIPVGTVKSRINSAKHKLKKEMVGELYV